MRHGEFFSLTYESKARTQFGAAELAALERSVIAQNLLHSVSGALIYDGTNFFQYLEGPSSGIDRAYSRIVASRRHSITRVVHRGVAAERYLPYWFMLVKSADFPTLQRSSRNRWSKALPSLPPANEMPEGLAEFVKFWGHG